MHAHMHTYTTTDNGKTTAEYMCVCVLIFLPRALRVFELRVRIHEGSVTQGLRHGREMSLSFMKSHGSAFT